MKRHANAGSVTDPRAEARQRALAAVDVRLAMARQRFSLAALSCLRQAIDAELQVQLALREVDQARAALREASEA